MSDRLLGRRVVKPTFNLKEELAKLVKEQADLTFRATALVIGRPVRILSDYNGQPYGRSRKSMKGREMTVERVGSIDPHWGISLFLRGERLAVWDKEVEWL
jgi:hypothetical protein